MGLQHLDLDQAECAVTNLSDATALTYLELKLVEGLQWPTTLQRLQTLKLVNSTARSGLFINLYRPKQVVPLEVYMFLWKCTWKQFLLSGNATAVLLV